MLKLIVFGVLGIILGFTFVANIFAASQSAIEIIKTWSESNNAFYNLVSQLFILATHPIMQLFLAFGMLFIIIRVVFGFM
ncbi:hypothetical protein [Spiroplasma melliferum]|uniref:Membrane protein n=2 Tax=Spiroplasma melliferum TaxID=2134 RepID=A0AAI9T3G2_SPIME|nr:hypothetical protein [Spiroplasma melliferum]ELL44356.1 plectrovirus SVTS2 ORF 9 uncharacterized protein [Spiroplasma melliferum IPMB4A]KAI92766.1 membrane protein [Spiroplasma melliferum KC3]QCO24396.1 Spiroplasmavirus-related protein [Spiroplasma melliferum]